MRARLIALSTLLAGCAAMPEAICRPELDRVNAQLAAEQSERERIVRAAARREEALRKQLDALKAIERGIVEREERVQSQQAR